MAQIFLLPAQRAQLLANGVQTAKDGKGDHAPVVKFFTPDGSATWLLTEIDPEDPTIAFGLCDLGMGYPELGSVSLTELQTVRGAFGLPAQRDLLFEAKGPISQYAQLARAKGGIVQIGE